MDAPLLHLITPPVWRAALGVGAIRPSVAEFVHLSLPTQVAKPANRLYAGRGDVYLLVIDRARVGVDLRWEPPDPPDGSSLLFPHAYGPIPTAAVLAVLPYRPGPDGEFLEPAVPMMDWVTRAATHLPSVLRRAATTETAVAGGVAIRTDAVPGSYQHNMLLVGAPVDAATVVAEADRALAGLPHRAAALLGDPLDATAADLRTRGWRVQEQAGMVIRPAGTPTGRVEQLDLPAVRPLWDAMWRRDLPHASDATLAQLSDRYDIERSVVDLRYLAVRERGAVVAAAVLRIDGATATLDEVGTDPAHRGRGHGDALVAEASALAAAAGCDVLGLDAAVDDWPRHWYARRGFVEVSHSWFAVAPTR